MATVQRAPYRSCWNISMNGLVVSYSWVQMNDSRPERGNIGFWVSLNGPSAYAKADNYGCERDHEMGYGHDTSGNVRFVCSASATFRFDQYSDLTRFAYAPNGSANVWDVAVAVSLDDAGTWDSLGGANYRFRF